MSLRIISTESPLLPLTSSTPLLYSLILQTQALLRPNVVRSDHNRCVYQISVSLLRTSALTPSLPTLSPGMTHGLILLPVLLSYFGGRGYASGEEEHEVRHRLLRANDTAESNPFSRDDSRDQELSDDEL